MPSCYATITITPNITLDRMGFYHRKSISIRPFRVFGGMAGRACWAGGRCSRIIEASGSRPRHVAVSPLHAVPKPLKIRGEIRGQCKFSGNGALHDKSVSLAKNHGQ